MRLRPALSAGLQRKTPAKGMTIAGTWIAGNTYVSLSAFLAHRDPRAYAPPEDFCPERWFGEEGKQLQRYNLTFSAGSRICIGKNITCIKQTMLVAATIRRYDFALPPAYWQMEGTLQYVAEETATGPAAKGSAE